MVDSDWFSCGDSRPWTKSSIHGLKHAIIAGGSSTDKLSYQELSLWYSRGLSLVVQRLRQAGLSIDSKPVDISFRTKTIETLREKLRRQPGFAINQIHDVMGVRIVADMSLDEQNVLTEQVVKLFDNSRTIDLRDHDHSGYRAIHVIVKLPCSVSCEIQIRTSLQDDWANCYEVAADIFGRKIRYGEFPDDPAQREVIERLQDESTELIRVWEKSRNMASVSKERGLQLIKQGDKLIKQTNGLNVKDDEHKEGRQKIAAEYIDGKQKFYESLEVLTAKTQEGESLLKARISGIRRALEESSQA